MRIAHMDVVEKGGSYTIMAAYNWLNGEHCYYNCHLLQEILRDERNYDGTVISDWGGVHDTELAVATIRRNTGRKRWRWQGNPWCS